MIIKTLFYYISDEVNKIKGILKLETELANQHPEGKCMC